MSRQQVVLRWQKAGTSQVRDAVLERSEGGAVRLTVLSGSGPDVFVLGKDGALDGLGWHGPLGAAPPDLVVWASLLSICQQADRLPVGEREVHGPASRVAVVKTADGLRSASILNTDVVETLSVVFR